MANLKRSKGQITIQIGQSEYQHSKWFPMVSHCLYLVKECRKDEIQTDINQLDYQCSAAKVQIHIDVLTSRISKSG
ncbi:MAG: hypothetical protein DMG65_14340 [Candidatus Angelobacter sp. Gp1-AA117]|nr:MAG: hypothetical protein DMG65_14340 [Candidatus Angelobacter sp. Gp1-AA117]